MRVRTKATHMPRNIANEQLRLESERLILTALKNLRLKRFNEIQIRTKLSTRTLFKRLPNLGYRGLIKRLDGGYRITSTGLEYLPHLDGELEKYVRHKMSVPFIRKQQLRECAVGVATTQYKKTPSGDCEGIFHVSIPRRLKPTERSEMDRALTEAIHIIVRSVPTDSKKYDVAIWYVTRASGE